MGALSGTLGVQIEGGVVDGTTYPVVPGNYHYAGVTEAANGGIYGTDSNWIEVTDPAVDNVGGSPSDSYYSSHVSGSETSNAVLPNTGFPAALCCLAGASLLVRGHIFRSRMS